MSKFGSVLTEKRSYGKGTNIVTLIHRVKLDQKKKKNKNIMIAAAAAGALVVSGYIISL